MWARLTTGVQPALVAMVLMDTAVGKPGTRGSPGSGWSRGISTARREQRRGRVRALRPVHVQVFGKVAARQNANAYMCGGSMAQGPGVSECAHARANSDIASQHHVQHHVRTCGAGPGCVAVRLGGRDKTWDKSQNRSCGSQLQVAHKCGVILVVASLNV